MFGSIAPFTLTTLLLATSPSDMPPSVPQKILRVCTSPACKDDGATSTLHRLTALSPPCVKIIKGGCTSLCGSGPIVEICNSADDVQSIKRKRVKDEALINLLDEFMQEDSDFTPYLRNRLLDGYDFHVRANKAFESKQYQSAVELYEEAIQNGRKPALALQESREQYSTTDEGESEGYPQSLDWIVTSFRNSCKSRLALGDIDGARRDAFAATVFSLNNDAESHECLADVCNASKDVIGEYQAVKAAMEQHRRIQERYSRPMPGTDAVGRAEAAKFRIGAENRQRELGFRLAKLERQLKQT